MRVFLPLLVYMLHWGAALSIVCIYLHICTFAHLHICTLQNTSCTFVWSGAMVIFGMQMRKRYLCISGGAYATYLFISFSAYAMRINKHNFDSNVHAQVVVG